MGPIAAVDYCLDLDSLCPSGEIEAAFNPKDEMEKKKKKKNKVLKSREEERSSEIAE